MPQRKKLNPLPKHRRLRQNHCDCRTNLRACHSGSERAPCTSARRTPLRSSGVASASADKSVRLWEVADGQGKPLGNHGGSVYAVAFAADGQRLATAGADALVKVWDVPGQKELKALKGHEMAVKQQLE